MYPFRIFVLVVLWLQSIGLSAIFIGQGSKLANYLFIAAGWQEIYTRYLDYSLAGALLFCALAITRKANPWALGLVFIIYLSQAFFSVVVGGNFGSELSLLAQMGRYGWPLIFALLLIKGRTLANISPSTFSFRLILAATFITHGIEAWTLKPQFLDFLLVGGERFVGIHLSQTEAELILRAIGILDVLVGALVIFRPSLEVLLWMGFWGFATAFMRVVFSSWQGVPDFLIRTAHWAIPMLVIAMNPVRISKQKSAALGMPDTGPKSAGVE